MSKLIYENWKPRGATLDVIDQANGVLNNYARQGFDLTLRQLYYQFVSKGWIANKQSEYNKLGSIVNKARLAGLIDWNHIEDRTRELESLNHFRNPAHVIQSSLHWFHTDRWADQPYYIEVWIEKDALTGVIEPVCQQNDIAFLSCRGYTSQSEMWGASQRMLEALNDGRKIIVLHLGDHDPSGIDMTRDIRDRLELFLSVDHWRNEMEGIGDRPSASVQYVRDHFQVNRLALHMEQVEQYGPPPNPAKLTDTRADAYIRDYGYESWELDALEPTVISALIENAIEDYRDPDLWYDACKEEERMRHQLGEVAARWPEVEMMLSA